MEIGNCKYANLLISHTLREIRSSKTLKRSSFFYLSHAESQKNKPHGFFTPFAFWIQRQDDVILISWTFKRKEEAHICLISIVSVTTLVFTSICKIPDS